MEVLDIKGLSAGYGKQAIVQDIFFSVKEGEIVGIFGENGCGKTTLLNAIIGLGTRITGKVFVSGKDMTAASVRERARYLTMLPSVTEIPEGILADEVLEMGWYARSGFLMKADEKAREEKARIISELELEQLVAEYFDKLSQGQKQRVLLGRMLLQDTPVFLMDEPDTSLDFKHKHCLFQKMRTIADERKKAGVMILHDPSLALTYCDRIFLMKEGKFADVICPREETEEQIAEKIEPITGAVSVTRCGMSIIIFP